MAAKTSNTDNQSKNQKQTQTDMNDNIDINLNTNNDNLALNPLAPNFVPRAEAAQLRMFEIDLNQQRQQKQEIFQWSVNHMQKLQNNANFYSVVGNSAMYQQTLTEIQNIWMLVVQSQNEIRSLEQQINNISMQISSLYQSYQPQQPQITEFQYLNMNINNEHLQNPNMNQSNTKYAVIINPNINQTQQQSYQPQPQPQPQQIQQQPLQSPLPEFKNLNNINYNVTNINNGDFQYAKMNQNNINSMAIINPNINQPRQQTPQMQQTQQPQQPQQPQQLQQLQQPQQPQQPQQSQPQPQQPQYSNSRQIITNTPSPIENNEEKIVELDNKTPNLTPTKPQNYETKQAENDDYNSNNNDDYYYNNDSNNNNNNNDDDNDDNDDNKHPTNKQHFYSFSELVNYRIGVEINDNLWTILKDNGIDITEQGLNILHQNLGVFKPKPKPKPKSFKKQLRSVLNKMTPEKFTKISVQVLNIVKEFALDKEKLEIILEIIIEFGINQSVFASQYALLCQDLCQRLPKIAMMVDYEWINNNNNENNGTVNIESLKQQIKKDIVSVIHSCFEKYKVTKEENKKKYLGVLIMIGELYNHQMLSSNIILQGILQPLLHKKNQKNLTEVDIEGICKMFKCCGCLLDQNVHNTFLNYLNRLTVISKKFEFRYQVLVDEINEMRNNSWKERIKKETAKTIAEIHKEFHDNHEYKNNVKDSDFKRGNNYNDNYNDDYNDQYYDRRNIIRKVNPSYRTNRNRYNNTNNNNNSRQSRNDRYSSYNSKKSAVSRLK